MSRRARQRAEPAPEVESYGQGSSADGSVEVPSPIRDGAWVDSGSTRWRLRGAGQAVPVKGVEHVLASPAVQVLLVYGPDAPSVVPPGDREALWHRMRPYLRESVARAPGDFTDFRVGEFRDCQRRSLLIEESC